MAVLGYRLKTQPGEEHDKLAVGNNELLAEVKAQQVADETGLVVVLEADHAGLGWRDGWWPRQAFFPSKVTCAGCGRENPKPYMPGDTPDENGKLVGDCCGYEYHYGLPPFDKED